MKIKQVLIGLGIIASLNFPKMSLAQLISGEQCIERLNECYSYSVSNIKTPKLNRQEIERVGNQLKIVLFRTNNTDSIKQEYFNNGKHQGITLTFYNRLPSYQTYKFIKIIFKDNQRILIGVEKDCLYSDKCEPVRKDKFVNDISNLF